MAPIVKETEAQSSSPGANTQAAPQPVALEVPVTVNGARTVEGSDKREPFSEATKTVLIFAHGAVIRLASSVTPGQLLFLTNENSKKEVVCQVVKSKNYRNVSGYVELEFTEPAPAFWGMRFPGERTSAKPAVSSVPAARPVEAKLAGAEPNTSSSLKRTSQNPPEAHTSGASQVATFAKSDVPAAGSPVIDFPRVPENKPASVLDDPKGASTASWKPAEADSELLKNEAARLREQLSSLSFEENGASGKQDSAKQHDTALSATNKVIEIAHREEHTGIKAAEAPTRSAASSRQTSNLDIAAEEVKIPAWLEPLARNTAAPTPVAVTHIEPPKTSVVETETHTAKAEEISAPAFQPEVAAPTFGLKLLDQADEAGEIGPPKSSKGLIIGLLAAGLILAAAGGWYFKFRSAPVVPTQTSTPTFATLPKPVDANPSTSEGNVVEPPSSSKEVSNSVPKRNDTPTTQSVSATGTNASLSAEAAKELVKIESAKKHEAVDTRPAEVAAKKPSLGAVQLAMPTVNASSVKPEDVAAPGLNLGNDAPANGDVASAGLIAGHGKQPKVPVAVGGDVKTARLLHAVPPVYPSIARSQHIAGDVVLDALIDATGRVSTMKVISGPVLLHQAAMDAVHQWRYQPAMLDDKPVAMHLNVKVQFRMQ